MRASARPRRCSSLYAGMMMESSGAVWVIKRSSGDRFPYRLAPAVAADERHKPAGQQRLLDCTALAFHDAKQLLMLGRPDRNNKAPALNQLVEQGLGHAGRSGGNDD